VAIEILTFSTHFLVATEIDAEHGDHFLQPERWADQMLDALPPVPIDSKDGALPDLNRLAAYYLTHLCVARM
jgi:hypothetical protein